MNWKDFIPKEEHHLYEDNEIQEEVIDPQIIQNNYSSGSIDDKIPFSDIEHAFEIMKIGENIKDPYRVLKDFASHNIPKNYNGPKEKFFNSVLRFYTETLADNLLPYNAVIFSDDFEVQDSVKKAHELAMTKTYMQVIEISRL